MHKNKETNSIYYENNILICFTSLTNIQSITVEDVEQYTSYNKSTYSGYGSTKQYTFDNTGSYTGIHEGVNFTVEDKDGNLIENTQGRTSLTKGSVATVQQTYYYYSINSYKKAEIPNNAYSMLTGGNYWLASRYCCLYSSLCSLGLRSVDSGSVDGYRVFNSGGSVLSIRLAVAPVVSLKSDIKATLQNDIWNLQLQN